jgi:hypothetical protein
LRQRRHHAALHGLLRRLGHFLQAVSEASKNRRRFVDRADPDARASTGSRMFLLLVQE